jgi:HPt (histidine-containing phosphotransfer) domain-containing protein
MMEPGDDIAEVEEDLADLIPLFLTERRRDLEELLAADASSDLAHLRRLGHSMKGTGGSYGFPRVSECGAQIEAAALAGDLEELRAAAGRLAAHLDRVRIVYVPA